MEIENQPSLEDRNISSEKKRQIVEAVLFSSDQPVTPADLMKIAEIQDKDELKDIIEALRNEYNHQRRSFQINDIANGYLLLTRPEFSVYVEKLYGKTQKYRLTRSALETLAIIAYKQPITKPLLDRIRGVESGYILNKLLEYDLIKVLGRAEKPGRPLLLGTTDNFLQYFGLKRLSDMPKLEELGDLDQYSEEDGDTGQEELPFVPDYGIKETPENSREEAEFNPEPENNEVIKEQDSDDTDNESNSSG
mgnify:CR=1 FL=1